MKLSVIIVNYNVKYFLEQALLSVRSAMQGIDGEVFVVDNNSVDDSVKLVAEKFPEVHLIANESNPGFSKANNQAIRKSKGEYVLLLNPDTVVQEDTFHKCILFMDAHPDGGGLGVKMIDGSGKFLPESKRGLPTPFVAFCKMFGLSTLFPKSKTFNHYHLGYLPENEINEIEVLAGAFMWLRKSVLEEVGLLDEAFFMYGEDIDLSYRINLGGYKNYYFPESSIIHYKGESTKKGSLNYVKTFYNAMIIFAQKHYRGEKARMLTLLLNIAIYFRGFLTLLGNLIKGLILPFIEVVFIFFGFIALKNWWAIFYFKQPDYYLDNFTYINIPLYISIWLGVSYLLGAYEKPFRWKPVIRGLLMGTLVIAAVYGFLELEYRSSRVLIILGFFLSLLVMGALRMIFHYLENGTLLLGSTKPKSMIVVGSVGESDRVQSLLGKVNVPKQYLGRVSVSEKEKESLGTVNQLDEIIRIYSVEEVIFCAEDISSSEIMKWMAKVGSKIDFRIIPSKSDSIIGSSSKNLAGELYTIDVKFDIDQPIYKRNKRMLDIIAALFILIFSPFLFLFQKNKMLFFVNIFHVIFNRKTWVGYSKEIDCRRLPKLKNGVVSPSSHIETSKGIIAKERVNFFYARDYNLEKDINIILLNWRRLG